MSVQFHKQGQFGTLAGHYDPKFARVAEEFERNYTERRELGSSVCVTLEGETVVDLWGGIAREASNMPWEKDTVSIVWSSTKGAVSFSLHILASRGLVDIDAPVTDYWPEYGRAGKEKTTVKMLLNHQSGVNAIRKQLPSGCFCDWEYMVAAIEEMEPFFEPGTAHGYQALTYGWLVGEIIRRVSGKSLGAFFQDEVARPLGIDFWIGLPAEVEPRVATMIMPEPPAEGDPVAPFFVEAANPGSVPFNILVNNGEYMAPGPDGVLGFDCRASHAAEIGAAGGITNGRGLAGMYAPLACGGTFKGKEFVSPDALARMGAVSSAGGLDRSLMLPTRFSLGFFKSIDNRREPPAIRDSAHVTEAAFGHPGFGGSIGFADPEARISFGYSMNRMGPGTLLNERGQSLVDATYLSLGYRSKASGSWIK